MVHKTKLTRGNVWWRNRIESWTLPRRPRRSQQLLKSFLCTTRQTRTGCHHELLLESPLSWEDKIDQDCAGWPSGKLCRSQEHRLCECVFVSVCVCLVVLDTACGLMELRGLLIFPALKRIYMTNMWHVTFEGVSDSLKRTHPPYDSQTLLQISSRAVIEGFTCFFKLQS